MSSGTQYDRGSEGPPQGARHGARRLYAAGGILVLALVVGVALIATSRAADTRAEAQRRSTEVAAGPRAQVVRAVRGESGRTLVLQGEARPFLSVTLYSKVSGYLRLLRVDRGDSVKAKEVVAVIQSPELDRQWDAARADAAFKRANARRSATLAEPGAVSVREAELDKSNAEVAEAQVASLATQRGYTVLRAPFDGVVTARFADPGALVQNAANAQSGALPVVTVSQVDRLRVFVYVDQRDAALVRTGDRAEVSLPDTGVRREATIARRSGELDPRTRTMLVEVDLDNRDGAIVAGSFVQVSLHVAAPAYVQVPAAALLVRAQKPYVGVVQMDSKKVRLRPVVVASDDGEKVGIESGVQEGELVALNLGRWVSDGDAVVPVLLASLGPAGPAQAPASSSERASAGHGAGGK